MEPRKGKDDFVETHEEDEWEYMVYGKMHGEKNPSR